MGAAKMKEVGDLVVRGGEALCLPRRPRALHLPFSSSRRLMCILGPVVKAPVLAVLDPWHHLALGHSITWELVGNHNPRRPALPLQQLPQQALGSPLVAPALHQHVEHQPGLIHGTPEPVLYPGDLGSNLVEVPLVSGAGQSPTDPVGELLAVLSAHCRTVSCLTTMPRAASISSTMRRPRGSENTATPPG